MFDRIWRRRNYRGSRRIPRGMKVSMHNITLELEKSKIDFLLKTIKKDELISKCTQALNKGQLYEKNYPTARYLITFSDSEKELLLDELSFLLTSIGLDQHDEVNEQGLLIDHIIDLLTAN